MSIIRKINQYLIERYPTVWNTKIVWMLAISFIFHLLFFGIGYISHDHPTSLHYGNVTDDFFDSGAILANVIISLLLLTGWLVMMFKNNAFKNFYPTKRRQLFGQFLSYLIIIFCAISFYFPYMAGFALNIHHNYPDDMMQKNIENVNKASVFLSTDHGDYLLSNRKYPEPLSKLHCETNPDYINYALPYFESHNQVFQFYSVYEVAITEKNVYGEYLYPRDESARDIAFVNRIVKNDTCYYYYADKVVDVSAVVKDAKLTYYNYAYDFYTNLEGNDNTRVNREVAELLDRKNPEEIKQILDDFLAFSNQLKIDTNLDTQKWFDMVYHPNDFYVQNFFHTNERMHIDYNDTHYYGNAEAAVEAAISNDETKKEINKNTFHEYYKKHLRPYYYNKRTLKNVLTNIDSVKNFDYFTGAVDVYLWLAFGLASLVFIFRVTSLRAVIFSGITAGVLSLFVAFSSVLYSFSTHHDFSTEYFALYLTLVIALIIISIPIFAPKIGSKLFRAILMNISIVGFVPFVFLILALISKHQQDACLGYSECFVLFDDIHFGFISWALFNIGLLFIFAYTYIIKRWRALPE